MRKTANIVKDLLEADPSLKDSDTRLTTHIWFRELEKMGLEYLKKKKKIKKIKLVKKEKRQIDLNIT